jgi:hypothetical protein
MYSVYKTLIEGMARHTGKDNLCFLGNCFHQGGYTYRSSQPVNTFSATALEAVVLKECHAKSRILSSI